MRERGVVVVPVAVACTHCAGAQDVNTLSAQVSASRSSVSQHLGRLRLVGLVQTRRDGRRVAYRVTSDHLRTLVGKAHESDRQSDREVTRR